MRYLFVILFLFLFQNISAQNEFLAKQYYNDGDYKKAVVYFEKIVKTNKRRTDYVLMLTDTYQQLERYTDAENLLKSLLKKKNAFPMLYIVLGQNYSLQKNNIEASNYFNKALKKIEENPNIGYSIAHQFKSYTLLDYAVKAFKKTMELNPKADYNYQLANIYGEQGDIEKMFTSFITLLEINAARKTAVLKSTNQYITDDPTSPNNIALKKILLKKVQSQPNVLWNDLLSWLFIQQKQYRSAFNQERAIYKREEGASLLRIIKLAPVCLENNNIDVAKNIYNFIIENSVDAKELQQAHLDLIALDLKNADEKIYSEIDKKYTDLLEQFGTIPSTIPLQISYANYLTFHRDNSKKGIKILKEALKFPLDRYTKASVRIVLADILVYKEQFNQALIYYSQVQKALKNHITGQNARFKIAQASFYKGDFDWALTQLTVLRNSSSQLIANDAMDLSLLISDNAAEDSTKTALNKYAKADLLAYQNKKEKAITILEDILIQHKGEKIEDEALLKQAALLIEKQEFEKAKYNYLKIIEFFGDGILADNAIFALAELYENQFNDIEKAKEYYEKLIFNHEDSIYFVPARKRYRLLRGDAIN